MDVNVGVDMGMDVAVDMDVLEQINKLNEKFQEANEKVQKNEVDLLKAHNLIEKLNQELVETKEELTKALDTISKRNSAIAEFCAEKSDLTKQILEKSNSAYATGYDEAYNEAYDAGYVKGKEDYEEKDPEDLEDPEEGPEDPEEGPEEYPPEIHKKGHQKSQAKLDESATYEDGRKYREMVDRSAYTPRRGKGSDESNVNRGSYEGNVNRSSYEGNINRGSYESNVNRDSYEANSTKGKGGKSKGEDTKGKGSKSKSEDAKGKGKSEDAKGKCKSEDAKGKGKGSSKSGGKHSELSISEVTQAEWYQKWPSMQRSPVDNEEMIRAAKLVMTKNLYRYTPQMDPSEWSLLATMHGTKNAIKAAENPDEKGPARNFLEHHYYPLIWNFENEGIAYIRDNREADVISHFLTKQKDSPEIWKVKELGRKLYEARYASRGSSWA